MTEENTKINAPMTIADFVAEAKAFMCLKEAPQEKKEILKGLLSQIYEENSTGVLKQKLLEAGHRDQTWDRIIYNDSDLSIIYGYMPPKLQSGIFDHASWNATLVVEGVERSVFYAEDQKKNGHIQEIETVDVNAGDVYELPPGTIRSIENPTNEETRVLQCYVGDIHELEGHRHCWDWVSQKKMPYSTQEVMRQGVERMHAENNELGLESVVEASKNTAMAEGVSLQQNIRVDV